MKCKTIKIDDVEYVRADEMKQPADALEGQPYVIVRTYSAGVFAGYLRKRDGKEVELVKARRLWYWTGAASLSQLAMEGVKTPANCKFPVEVDEVVLTEAIEILNVTKAAQESIAGVPVWQQ